MKGRKKRQQRGGMREIQKRRGEGTRRMKEDELMEEIEAQEGRGKMLIIPRKLQTGSLSSSGAILLAEFTKVNSFGPSPLSSFSFPNQVTWFCYWPIHRFPAHNCFPLVHNVTCVLKTQLMSKCKPAITP